MRCRSSVRMETSSIETGSSATTRSGPMTRAPAITTRWRCPPDSSWGKRKANSRAGRSPADSMRLEDAPLAVDQGGRHAVDHERLGHEVEDRLLRVQRLVRVLEDQLDAPPVGAQRAHAPQRRDVLAVEEDAAPGLAGELDDDAAGRRLARARLADEAQDLAGPDGQVDAVDRPDPPCRAAPDRVEQPATDGEVHLEPLQADELIAHAVGRSARATSAEVTATPPAAPGG